MTTFQTLTIPEFSPARVLVMGDVMLDRYWYGPTSRISPEAPVPVVHVQDVEERPGGAGNVAVNVAALGAQAVLVTMTGDDEPADTLQSLLEAHGVECRFQRQAEHPTVTKLRVVSRHQQLIRMDFEAGFSQDLVTKCGATLPQSMASAGAVVMSDYDKGALARMPELIALARKAGVPVLIDPKGNDFSIYRGASVITPNLSEFEAVVGRCADLDVLVQRGEALCRELELGSLLITRSEHGMTLLRPGDEALHLPAHAREVFDVTGAGDTVIAVMAACLAAGQSLPEAMQMANLAAAQVVAKLGTASVSVAELHAALVQHQPLEQGVVDEPGAVAAVRGALGRGEKVVMTNGCFDILHAGHVSYLRQARALGDRLVVAVNDDASVKRLKGPERPINPLSRRMTVLAALESVDWVVPFSEDTPERLICAVQPNLLVKGGDYRPEDIAGGDCVRGGGGRVVVLGYEKGVSTTEIIEAINRSADEPEPDVESK